MIDRGKSLATSGALSAVFLAGFNYNDWSNINFKSSVSVAKLRLFIFAGDTPAAKFSPQCNFIREVRSGNATVLEGMR